MTKMLANEKVAAEVVSALRADGHDVSWISEVRPGSADGVEEPEVRCDGDFMG